MVKTKSVQKGGYWYWRPSYPNHFVAKRLGGVYCKNVNQKCMWFEPGYGKKRKSKKSKRINKKSKRTNKRSKKQRKK